MLTRCDVYYLVHEAVQYVADEFSKDNKIQYQAAVKKFRLPYWGK